MKAFLLLCIACCIFASNPESQIIVREHFISKELATTLMQYYDSVMPQSNSHSDNELSVSLIKNPSIQKLVRDLSDRVIELMKQSYHLSGKIYRLDHAGLYARIERNYCPYHADNVYFDCPIHGRDQGRLRSICPGTCSGAKFVPNHTAWREYTALIYLNEDFEGGEIAFEDGPQNRQYKKTIPIQANSLVLAPNGPNFYHEVFPIRKGKRYSLHLWFTSDPRHWH